MKSDWDCTVHRYVSKDRRNILLQYAGFSRKLSKIFVLLTYFISTQLFLLPFFFKINKNPIRKRWYPGCAWYYFDQFSNGAYAFFYSLQLFVGVGLGISVNLGLDSFCCVAVSHTCAQLNIFQKELLELGSNSKVSQGTMKQIIQKHNRQIRTAQLLSQIFNGVSLSQLLVSCIAICTSGFQLIVVLNKNTVDLQGVILNTSFLLIALFQILLYCWPSNELMVQSMEVGNAAYQSLWTNLSQSSCREIKLLILRSQRPMNITAGKTYILSLSRFIGILKTSMQCLSYLRASYKYNERLG